MKTYRVTAPFILGGREYGPGKLDTITEAELGPYAADLAACVTEATAPLQTKPAAYGPPKPAPEPEL